ncbi:hypothetical protein AYJ54_38945 [Bradyrhizobium centrolobii]|uniref:LamG-like jellyroll fold domain-containing protein n=1 Tax=Bradyrhizobium centrolobii TaxID=1505087 RepID=A0A176Z8F1_9BRAD|nr:hypothetical protein AYJ54_38945 [Bradyrhizobium centrolobii]
MPEGAFVVPDPNLIFHGEFRRAGVDLVLSNDGHEFVVHDYFRGDKRAAIASPDGAHLTGDIVNALTGHVQYAQAAPGAVAVQVIGHVTKLAGSATALRNGVSIILNNGDNVEKGDAVSTGADSTLGITFIDGTVFGLSSSARMVLNEMVYDPNGSNNSSLLSLVAGTITFVAGETAKHGDMKIDTPVATMGIRGTAVLTQINFIVPSGGGDPQPQANFQVLVEPDGTTGSYILFDKTTLLPIATVNQAGQMIQISGGNVSITNGLLSPDVQKLINDVFTLKFTDNNTNTKLTSNFTDTITQTSDGLVIKTAAGFAAIPTFVNLNQPGPQAPFDPATTSNRIPGPPQARSLDLNGNPMTVFTLIERADKTGDTADSDTISGRITFLDFNRGDRPTVKVNLADAPNYVYKNAGQQDVTASLTALQKQDIAATQVKINVEAASGNDNNGSAVWTYTIPDNVFDFLAAGETLTLTYIVRVDNNFEVSPETTFIPITITITGTNDKPVITTSVPTITFAGGTSVPGGPLTSNVPTSGTLAFTDVDLTDTHTVSAKLTSASLPGGGTLPPGPLAVFQNAMSVAIAAGSDSTGDGTGTINWSLADLPVYLADFIPKGKVLTLTYTVTVTDSQGATATQTITVAITGTDAPAVVWIATDKAGAGDFWKDAANWETGTVPTINDDVIVITDQLHGLTPSYPVTIDAAAFAKSITMNDFGGPPPKVINQSSLTIAGTLNMSADSIFINSATGTMSVGGKAEILGTSVLSNAGYLTLAAGGDFASGTTITNSGTIELSGGTLKTLAGIHNAGGTLKADAGTTLIVDTATIDGGTVTIAGTLEIDGASVIENGTLNNSGAVKVKGAVEFANETVANKSGGTIEVFADGTLTIDQGSSVTNTGNVTVDANGKLTINGASINGAGTVTGNDEIDLIGNAVLSGGTLKNNVALKVSGSSNALHKETITNAGTIEVLANGALIIDQGSTIANSSGTITIDGNAALTLSGTEITGGTINNYSGLLDGTIHITGDSEIDGNATLNKGAVKVDSAVLLTLDDATVAGATIANGGTVQVDANKKLTLNGATIDGGTVTIAGTLESTGTSVIKNGDVTNTGTITVTSGTLTIDPAVIHTITNHKLIEVSGGELDISGENITNTADLKAVTGGTLKLTTVVVINNGGTITVNGTTSKLYLSDVTINDGSLNNSGNLYSVSGDNTVTAVVTNTGTIEVQAGTLDLAGGISGAGTLIIDDGATLEFAGATGPMHITNSGSILSADGHAAIDIQESSADSTLIDNSGSIGPDAATVTSKTYAIVETGGSITINNTGDINGNISVATATFNNEAHGTWTVSGTSVFGTMSSIGNAGEIDLLNGASIAGADGTFTINNSGAIESWGTASITGTINNTSTIEVHTGTLTLFGSLSGAGSVTIDAGATLEVNATVSQTITFAGAGAELQIDTSDFGGSIAGFAATDKIDLSGIEYGLGTSAVYVSNAAHTGGVLTVTDADGHSISLTLIGDYSKAHFAGSADSDGGTLITYNAEDDKPTFTQSETSQGADVSEQADLTGSSTQDPTPAATGTIHFTDVDLTDRPTATITGQTVTGFAADHVSPLTLTPDEVAPLEKALMLQTTGKNNGAVSWSYSIADSALDFLGEGQTAKVVSTITLDDGQGKTDTAEVTVTITGANDAPKISYGSPNYLAFDGATAVSGAVSTHNTGNGSDGVSLQGWVNWSGKGNPGDSQLLFYNGSTSDAGFGVNGVVTDDGKLDLQIQNGGIPGIDTNVTIDANQAHNIALTHVDGHFTLYVDGVVAYTTTASVNGIPAGHADFTEIGGVPTEDGTGFATEGFQGSISDVSIWSTALTQAQVQANQTVTLTGSESNLVGLFPLQDGSGTTVANLAGSGGNLTIHGNAAWIDAAPGGVSASLTETNTTESVHGTLTVSDADSTDHVTVAVDHVAVYLDGMLQTDGIDGLSNAALLNYLSVQSGDILNGTATHADFDWNFNSNGQAFDFLAAGQTLSLQYTIVPSDGHTATGTGNGVVTINITGTNDAPTLDDATLPSVAGNESDPSGSTISDLFAGKFHDVDDGACLKAIAVTYDGVSATEGVWQYEVDGRWVDIGSVDDAHALVLSPDTLLRFVPADGYTGTPGTLGVHALDDTYTGAVTTCTSTATIDITKTGTGGTTPVSSDLATISTDVTAPTGGPVIDTANFHVWHNNENNRDTITDLLVVDSDSGASTDTFTVTVSTAHPSVSSVDLYPTSGSLCDINLGFENGVTYNPGDTPPDNDQITLTVTDSSGHYDTVHFIFSEAGDTRQGITLQGTSGKDVIFATETGDTLIGGGGKDQFVFSPNSSGSDGQHTINDFATGLDKIDLRQFSDVCSMNDLTITQQSDGTLVTWQQEVTHRPSEPVTEHETLLLKNVALANLKGSDFIFHA